MLPLKNYKCMLINANIRIRPFYDENILYHSKESEMYRNYSIIVDSLRINIRFTRK